MNYVTVISNSKTHWNYTAGQINNLRLLQKHKMSQESPII